LNVAAAVCVAHAPGHFWFSPDLRREARHEKLSVRLEMPNAGWSDP
jgi:hypothetical protein